MTPDTGHIAAADRDTTVIAAAPRLVSIIITNYNYARYVGAAIDSALAQTHPHCEVVVVDDGSKDDSRTVLQAYRGRPGVRLIFQENGGQAAAFNTGFAAASGEFILFLDADDLLGPDAVATVLDQWRHGLSRIQFPLQMIDPDGRGLGLHPFSHRMDDGDLHWKIAVSGHIRFIPTSGNMFSRAALAPVFPVPAKEWRLCADSYIIYQSSQMGPVANLEQALGFYRLHDSNNWYREGRDRDQLQQVWRQIFQLWNSAIQALQPYLASGNARQQARYRDQAALYLLRRLITGHISVGGLIAAGELRRLIGRARRRALTAAVPWRQKLLYLACFLMAGAKGWRFAAARWNAHHSLRPVWLHRLVERLKGEDFYEWQSAVAPLSPVPEFAIGRTIQFGRGREGNRHLWYGWEQGDPMQAASSGRIATLIGRVPAGGGDLTLDFALIPVVHPAVEWQGLAVDANGTRIFEGRMFEPQQIRLSVPRAVARRNDVLVLKFTMPDVFVPRLLDDTTPSDFRPQGFALATMEISSSVSTAGETAGMFLPAGRCASAAELHAGGALMRGWHEPDANGIARFHRAEAQLSLTVLDGAALDHIVELEFAVEHDDAVPRATVEVSAAGEFLGIVDVKRDARLRLLVPPGVVSETGVLTLSLVPSGLWQQGEDWPAGWPQAIGPGLRALRLERAPQLAQHPVYRSGLVLNFDSAGAGLPYRDKGWHKPDGQGSVMADTVAELKGVWLDRDRDIFLTAVVHPPVHAPNLPPQQLTLVCNGCTVAIYNIAETAEITAVIPPGVVAEDGLLAIEFRVTRLLRLSDYGREGDNRLAGIGLRLLSLE